MAITELGKKSFSVAIFSVSFRFQFCNQPEYLWTDYKRAILPIKNLEFHLKTKEIQVCSDEIRENDKRKRL